MKKWEWVKVPGGYIVRNMEPSVVHLEPKEWVSAAPAYELVPIPEPFFSMEGAIRAEITNR